MKKPLLIILPILALFVGFFLGLSVGMQQFDRKLIEDRTEAIRDVLKNGTVESQARLSTIDAKLQSSESKKVWYDFGIIIIFAYSVIQPWLIKFHEIRLRKPED